MIHRHVFSAKQKILGLVGVALLALLVIVGYAKAAQDSQANALLAQTQNGGRAQAELQAQPGLQTPTDSQNLPQEQQDQARQQKQQQDDIKNQREQIKQKKDHLQNLRRQIQDILRVARNANVSVANEHISQFEACITVQEAKIGQPEFWNDSQDCEDHSRGVEDELNSNLRPQQKCAEVRKNIENRKKEKKSNIDRQIKDILKNDKNADVSQLNDITAQITANFSKIDGLAAGGTCNEDVASELEDAQRDLDGLFQDYYGSSQEINDKANENRRASEGKKDLDKNIKTQCKNKLREFKNYEKDFVRVKKSGEVGADAESLYNDIKNKAEALCTTSIAEMERALAADDIGTFEELRTEYWNQDRDFWDSLNEARNEVNQRQQSKDVLRDLGQKEKDFEKMKKEYERIFKKSGENANTKKLLDDYGAAIEKARETAGEDPQGYWNDFSRDLGDLQNEFWNFNQKAHAVVDVSRWMKDIQRDIRFRENDLKKLKKECPGTGSQLEEIFNQMKNSVEDAARVAADDPDAARENLESMDDFRRQWDDVSQSCWQGKQMAFEISEGLREIDFALEQIPGMERAGRITEDQVAPCRDFLNEARNKLANFRIGSGVNPEEEFAGLEEEGNRICPFLENMEDAPPPDHAYFRNFIEQNVEDMDKDVAASVLEKVSQNVVDKVIARLLKDPTVVSELLRAAGDKNQAAAAGALEAVSNFYDENAQRDLLAKKAEILDMTKQLEDVKSKLQAARDKLGELQALQDEIAGYNFYGSASDTIRNEMEAFVNRVNSSGMTRDQIRAGIEQLKVKKVEAIQSSKVEKYQARIIPFMDTDDNSWYTQYVAPLARLGIVQGKGEGMFDPGAGVTVAEALTMAFRVSGDDEEDGGSALCNGRYGNHWADKFVKWAEEKGLSIIGACIDINRPAQRWEVAQILLETASNGTVETSNEQCFSDVRPTEQPVNSVVCRALQAGLLKGVNGKANAHAPIIRAEAATIVKQAAEKLFGVNFDQASERQDDQNGQGSSMSTRQSADETDFEESSSEDFEEE